MSIVSIFAIGTVIPIYPKGKIAIVNSIAIAIAQLIIGVNRPLLLLVRISSSAIGIYLSNQRVRPIVPSNSLVIMNKCQCVQGPETPPPPLLPTSTPFTRQ